MISYNCFCSNYQENKITFVSQLVMSGPFKKFTGNISCKQPSHIPSAFSRRAVVSYWRKYVHEVLVNRLGGLSLPRKSVVRSTDSRPDMTLDVYRGRKTTIQQPSHTLHEGPPLGLGVEYGHLFYNRKHKLVGLWVGGGVLWRGY